MSPMNFDTQILPQPDSHHSQIFRKADEKNTEPNRPLTNQLTVHQVAISSHVGPERMHIGGSVAGTARSSLGLVLPFLGTTQLSLHLSTTQEYITYSTYIIGKKTDYYLPGGASSRAVAVAGMRARTDCTAARAEPERIASMCSAGRPCPTFVGSRPFRAGIGQLQCAGPHAQPSNW